VHAEGGNRTTASSEVHLAWYWHYLALSRIGSPSGDGHRRQPPCRGFRVRSMPGVIPSLAEPARKMSISYRQRRGSCVVYLEHNRRIKRGVGGAGAETVAGRDGGTDCSGLRPRPWSPRCRFRHEATPRIALESMLRRSCALLVKQSRAGCRCRCRIPHHRGRAVWGGVLCAA
jgi:hypothetical protein